MHDGSLKSKNSFVCNRADVAQALLYLDGQPFSLEDYPCFTPIYNGTWPRLLMKCGRQVSKSTFGCNYIIANSTANPFFKTLYIAPTQKQASIFSSSRLGKTIAYSAPIARNFTGRDAVMSRWLMQFTNGSEVHVGYASDDPDRIRSISSDQNIYDEIQDIVYKSVVPVVNECMANSNYGYEVYLGTPKSMDNTIEFLWQQSTQDEWLMKCAGCNKYNFVVSGASLGKRGIICVKCGKYVNPREGVWHSMNAGAPIKGFHVPQPALPLHSENPERWERLLYKYEVYPETKFKNEVLGVSDSIGTRMVSKQDLEALCRPYTVAHQPTKEILEDVLFTVAGVDWSGGGSSNFSSRTVVWIWGLLPDGRLKTVYFHIFQTRNAAQDVRDVAEVCAKYNCKIVAGDAGVGAVSNAMMSELLGAHRMVQMQYGSLAKQIRWNGRDRYMVDRTAAIDSMMLLYKNKGVIFPNVIQSQQPISDILAEYEEVTKSGEGKKIWAHIPAMPDDCLHAQVFGWLAAEIAQHKIKFYAADAA